MAGNDDIVASLRKWAPLIVKWAAAPTAGQVMVNAATALTERDAQIERLTKERDERNKLAIERAARAASAEARATAAERELAEARAEVERLKEALAPFAEVAAVLEGNVAGENVVEFWLDGCFFWDMHAACFLNALVALRPKDIEKGGIHGNTIHYTPGAGVKLSGHDAALAKGGADGDA